MKIVINRCYGDFGVSKKVYDELGIKYSGNVPLTNYIFGYVNVNPKQYRTDERLIKAIEKIGLDESAGGTAELKIIEVPDGIHWYIDQHEGKETVHERHRCWR